MTTGLRTIIFPVKDLDRAKVLYRALLGTEPSVDQPYYVGFDVDGQHIGLDPHGHDKGLVGPIGYRDVEDIAAAVQQLLDAGAELVQPVSDVGGGKLAASVKDADGNGLGLIQS